MIVDLLLYFLRILYVDIIDQIKLYFFPQPLTYHVYHFSFLTPYTLAIPLSPLSVASTAMGIELPIAIYEAI